MDNVTFWKNFNLGKELDIAGNFIYNGMNTFYEMSTFYYESEVFEFLYNISVGIERLEKIQMHIYKSPKSFRTNNMFKSSHFFLNMIKCYTILIIGIQCPI